MTEKIFYFAYGSNLYLPAMAKRCPGAVVIGAAQLPDHRLVERGYADVDQAPGCTVYGGLYEIAAADLAQLDLYEGYPALYTRHEVRVRAADGEYTALVYEMTPEAKRQAENDRYSPNYRAVCSAGARMFGIPDGFVGPEARGNVRLCRPQSGDTGASSGGERR